jgi:hypothetical protein
MTATGLSLGTLALLTLLATDNAHAQSFQGYGLLGRGSYSNRFGSGGLDTVAGGADVLIARGFGVEGEVGLVGLGPTASLDGVFQIQRLGAGRVVPFVRAGLTHTKGEYSSTYDGPNVGGGLILWLRPHAGLRVEYLHVVQSMSGGWTENHDLLRVGVSFR